MRRPLCGLPLAVGLCSRQSIIAVNDWYLSAGPMMRPVSLRGRLSFCPAQHVRENLLTTYYPPCNVKLYFKIF